MNDPIVALSLAVAFALTVTAILLTRRASERPREDDVEGAEQTERRYVNGGWH